MIDNQSNVKIATITAENVMSAKSGVGLRWVLAVSLATMVVITIMVVGINIASHSAI